MIKQEEYLKALDIVRAYRKQLNASDYTEIHKDYDKELIGLNRNDIVEYIGGSSSKYLTLGNKYRVIRKQELWHRKIVIKNDALQRVPANPAHFKFVKNTTEVL
jgi:hypothetical protein